MRFVEWVRDVEDFVEYGIYTGPIECPFCIAGLLVKTESYTTLSFGSWAVDGFVCDFEDGMRMDNLHDFSHWSIVCTNGHVIAQSTDHDDDCDRSYDLYFRTRGEGLRK